MSKLSLYNKDFSAWAHLQADLLKSKDFNHLDLMHLIEEVEDMGNQNKHELKNRLIILIMHLLKWKLQPERKGNSWYQTIANQRIDIAELLEDNPSLKHFLPEIFPKAYGVAVSKASLETGINKKAFPLKCIWDIEQILDEEFFPES